MKILLLNDNPVVNKLVTLSAQKTSDELDVASSLEEVQEGSYDLLVLDDTLYTEDIMESLKSKVDYSKSLYIYSKNTGEVEGFTSMLKKPFLPTDLVELFSTLGKEANSIDLEDDAIVENVDVLEEELLLEESTPEENDSGDLPLEEDEFSLDDDLLLENDDLSLDDDLSLEEDDLSLDEDDISLDEELSLEDDTLDGDDLSLDDDLSFEDDDLLLDEDDISLDEELSLEEDSAGVLDQEEVQELQELLEETETEVEEEIETPDELSDELELEKDLEAPEEVITDEELADELVDELELDSVETESSEDITTDFNEEDILEEEVIDDAAIEPSEETDDSDLESQIENALDELSDEDLESEIDEDTLLDIAEGEFDSLDSLNARDLKLAIGEEVDELQESEETVVESVDAVEDLKPDESEDIPSEQHSGVEALKNLLTALSDKNVAASMKGMKISINITLGDE